MPPSFKEPLLVCTLGSSPTGPEHAAAPRDSRPIRLSYTAHEVVTLARIASSVMRPAHMGVIQGGR